MTNVTIEPRLITVHDRRGDPLDIGIANRIWTPDIGSSETHYYRSIRRDIFGSPRSASTVSCVVKEHRHWAPGKEVSVEFPLLYEKQRSPS